jgi:hypothetical protein
MLLTEVGISAVQMTGNNSDSGMLSNELNSVFECACLCAGSSRQLYISHVMAKLGLADVVSLGLWPPHDY